MFDYAWGQMGKMAWMALRVGIHATRTAIAAKKAIEAKKAAYNGPEDGDGQMEVVDTRPITDQLMTNPTDEFGMTESIVGALVNTGANLLYKYGAKKEVKVANEEEVNI